MSHNRLFSYWSGPVGWMERLTVETATKHGYDVVVYSYKPDELRLPCWVMDAREVMPKQDMLHAPYFADWFRAEALAQGRGTWTDLDVVYLGRLPVTDYLYGWASHDRVNNAILRLPQDSAALADYLTYCRVYTGTTKLPPWFPLHLRLARRAKYALRGRIAPAVPAPRALTHLLGARGLLDRALPREVLYPVASCDAHSLVGRLPSMGSDTVCVHLWNSMWPRGPSGEKVRPSWLSQL